jgi:hypothetical protein
MIAAPPLSTGGVQRTVIDVAVALPPVTPVGAPGVLVVVLTAAEAADQPPQPTELSAMTWKRYEVPGVSPVQFHVVPAGVVVGGYAKGVAQVRPPSVERRTPYRMIGAPPLLAGGVQLTAIEVVVAVPPVTAVGAPGVVVKVLLAGDVADQPPQPAEFMAMTWKRYDVPGNRPVQFHVIPAGVVVGG